MTRRPHPAINWPRFSPLARFGRRLAIVGLLPFAVLSFFAVAMTVLGLFPEGNASSIDRYLPGALVFAVVGAALLGVPLAIIGLVLIRIGQHRTLVALHACRFARCPACAYDLSGTPRLECCPECSRRFGRGGVIREWGRILPRRGRRLDSGKLAYASHHQEGSR